MAIQFAWLAGLLSFLAGFKKLFLWLGLAIPFISQIVGWVGRIWGAARNTLLGRFLRMAGFLSVAGLISIGLAKALFALLSEAVQSTPTLPFSWPTNSLFHSAIGFADLLIPLTFVLDLLVYSVYLALFMLSIRLGKYILSLTTG